MREVKKSFHALHGKWQQERENRYKRSLATKSKLIREGLEIFRKFKIKKVILYGSVLENNMRENSDIDILVDFLPPDKFFSFQCQLEGRLNVSVDVHTMDEDEKFTRKILQRGEVIYEV
jgi:predicted nucleotidyltransferase